jgi:hypothetical protein
MFITPHQTFVDVNEVPSTVPSQGLTDVLGDFILD